MKVGKKVKEWDIPKPIKITNWPKPETKPAEMPKIPEKVSK